MVRISIIAMGLLGILVSGVARAGHGAHVVIAEAQVGGGSASDEFVELYNPTSSPVALEHWRLSKRTGSGAREENLVTDFPVLAIAPHASVLVAHPQGTFAAAADQRYSTQSSLANDNTIVLYGAPAADGTRAVIDLLGMGTATSREGTAAPNPPAGQSLERKPGGTSGNHQDTDDNAADFVLLTAPTPQAASAAARPAVAADDRAGQTQDQGTGNANTGTTGGTNDGGANAGDGAATDTTANASPPPPSSGGSATTPGPVPPITINEFVADPASGDEWIELVNTGTMPVNLVGWAIEDGAETRTALTGAVGIGDQRFALITRPKGQLNNSGDRIVLLAPDGRVADAVSYGDWDDGKVNDNAPAASDPASVARVVDGADTNSDLLDFVRTETPTPAAANIVSAVSTEPTGEGAPSTGTARRAIIVLNELFPNPPGDDRQDEYIEIANIGGTAADLAGWRLRDELGAEYVVAAADGPAALAPGSALTLARTRTGIALNNTGGETVRLFAPASDRAASVAEYTGAAAEGAAWARGTDGRWQWTTTRTPGNMNTIAAPNRAPDPVMEAPEEVAPGAVIAFDASDSADPDRETLTYAWDFGDPRTEADHAIGALGRYVYADPGTYTVRLTVTDVRGASATGAHRIVVRAAVPANAATAHAQSEGFTTASLRISEALPNPVGSDEGEWVEIANAGSAPIALDGWALEVGGSDTTPRRMELHDLVTPAGGYAVVRRPLLRGNLRNDAGTIALVDPDGQRVDALAYGAASEGKSWAMDARGQWGWAMPTPGGANGAVRVGAATQVAGWTNAPVAAAHLGDLARYDLGSRVTIRGVVSAPPGAVGAQIFYLADASGGVQVYVGKREIPTLALGSRVEVSGELREVSGERRVGIAAATDVRVLEGAGEVPDALAIRAQDAREELLGTLVVVEGDVVDIRGRTLDLDDGSEEIRAVLPAAAPITVTARDTVRLRGILTQTRAGYRVLARGADDVEAIARTAPPVVRAPITLPSPRALEVGALALVALAGAWVILRRWRGTRTQAAG